MLLYHRSCGITARRLARLLGLPSTRHSTEQVVIIRWGASFSASNDQQAINSALSIALAAHGINPLRHLATVGVPVPRLYCAPPEDLHLYPILGRRVYHRAGTDIVWCDTPEEARESGSSFWTGYFPVHKELRVHVFGEKVLRVFRKVPRRNDADTRVRTSLQGWGYQRVGYQHYARGQLIAIQAVAALGLTFGGVDLGWNEETKKYVVFEVNTAPSLNSISLLYYGREFERYLLDKGVNYEPTGYNWTEKIERAIACSNDTE